VNQHLNFSGDSTVMT